MYSLRFAVAASLMHLVLCSNVVVLDSANFTEVIGKGKPALVEFYAPWCGHCKNLAPIYEKLGDAFAHAKDKVIIAQVDADGPGREIGGKQGVSGFPTLKWFNGDSADVSDKYEGGRELEDLATFIQGKTGVAPKIKLLPPPAATLLYTDNFDEIVMDPTKDVLVAFTAPWCGHCKALKPHLEKAALDFEPESSVVVALIDVDAAPNRHLGTKYDIKGYPTLKLFPKGSDKTPVEYSGFNTEADLVKFINEHAGTHRAVGGGLNDFAGRVATLDDLAQQIYHALPATRAAIYDDAVAAATAIGSAGDYYLKVMKKLLEGSEEWVLKESKRLKSILDKKSAPTHKLDEVTKKLNILTAFVQKKVEEAVEAIREEL